MEISLERLLQRSGRAGRDLKEFSETGKDLGRRRREETLLYGVRCFFFVSWRIMGLQQGCPSSNDSVFACAHGDCECLRLDACAGFTERMELAL